MTEPLCRGTTRPPGDPEAVTGSVVGIYYVDVPPGTPVVVLTETDYERLVGAVDDAQRQADEWQARWEDQDHQWVKDHPTEAAQALIDAGHLVQSGWRRSNYPPALNQHLLRPDGDGWEPTYSLVLPTEETPHA